MMRRAIPLLALLLLAAPAGAAAPEEARALIREIQDLLRADTNVARYRMTIVTPDWERTIRMKSWDDRETDRFFIHILAPKKDEDTTFLKVGSNLWMYIPKLERDIRIPPSMMLSSWMGSDFTNDDLVKSSSVVDDYTHRIVGREGGVVTVESIPKPDAPVVWGKLVHRIGPDLLPVSEDFFDEHGNLVRRLHFEAPKVMDGRRIPTRWIVVPQDEPGHRTIMEVEEIRFDVPIDPAVFERDHLRRPDRRP